MTDRIYLTVIPRDIDGDTYFPKISPVEFRVIESKTITAAGVEPYDFFIYERIK